MEAKFYVGQKIVAIENHRHGDFKKGQIFEVLDLDYVCCGWCVKINNECNGELINIHCPEHNTYNTSTKGVFYDEKIFAPIQEISDMTFEEAIELVIEKETIKI